MTFNPSGIQAEQRVLVAQWLFLSRSEVETNQCQLVAHACL